MQDRLDQRPAVAEARVAEAGTGLADDQRVDHPALRFQPLGKACGRARALRQPAGAVADDGVVAVDRIEPAVEYTQHGFGGGVVLRKRAQQLAAVRGRIGDAPAGERHVN